MYHSADFCDGNCQIHPLMRPDFLMPWANINDMEFERIEAAMTPEEREHRIEELATEAACRRIEQEALIRAQYARSSKERALIGVKRGQKPVKIQLPCKWVIGEFAGQECWAWEYMDPKSGKRECPHTCQRLHPGEAGWNPDWLRLMRKGRKA